MRIGIDSGPLSAPVGGIRRYTEQLVASLARLAPENEYVLFGVRESVRRAWEEAGFRCLAAASDPLGRVRAQLRLPRPHGPLDLLHGTNYRVPLLERIPYVITVHDLSVRLLPHTHPWRRRAWHRLLPHLCRRAVRVIADSASTRRDLIRCYGLAPEKIDVVHLAAGADFAPVRDERRLAELRARYGLPERFLLFLGAVEPRKNLEPLLDAMAALRREGRRERLVVAGSGAPAYVEALRGRARALGLEEGEDVLFAGPVAEADLPALYSACHLFVYPSLYEGFGLPPLEAMACGAPVLLARNSALAELYEDCGAAVDLSAPGALAAALRRALDDGALREELVARGGARARARSWDDVAADTLAVYRAALAAL